MYENLRLSVLVMAKMVLLAGGLYSLNAGFMMDCELRGDRGCDEITKYGTASSGGEADLYRLVQRPRHDRKSRETDLPTS